MSASITWVDGVGSASLVTMLNIPDRFNSWTPNYVPIGPTAVGLGNGQTYNFPFRNDLTINFEINPVAGTDLELALRLKMHLMSRGEVFVSTTNFMATFFETCILAPGTEPQISFSDSTMMEYTFSVTLLAGLGLAATTGGVAGPWSPAYAPGLKLWLRANDLLATTADGGYIGTWPDASGNANNATQSTGSLQPVLATSVINSYPVVRYVSPRGPLQTPAIFNPATNGMTMFFVARRYGAWHHTAAFFSFSTIPPTGTQANDNTVRDSGDGFYCTNQGYIGWNLTGTECTNGVIVTPSSTWAVGCISMSSGLTMTGYQNGVAGSSWTVLGSISGSDSLIVGGGGDGGTLNADIAEVLMYEGVLGTSNRNAVIGYLGTKYGITI